MTGSCGAILRSSSRKMRGSGPASATSSTIAARVCARAASSTSGTASRVRVSNPVDRNA
jgi:hypothetical protein